MITELRGYARQGRHLLRKWLLDPRFHTGLRITQCLLSGFLLSAASLGHYAQPIALGLVCTAAGWPGVLMALGAMGGYWLFWGNAGFQGMVWIAAGLPTALLLGRRPTARTFPMLLPIAAGMITAATGLLFQLRFGDTTPVLIYFLRICTATASTQLFLSAEQNRSPTVQNLVWAVWVLALAQVVPVSWLNPGIAFAAALMRGGSFPAAALSGLALDLAQITPVPMTAVACAVSFLRQLPVLRKWMPALLPAAVYTAVMGLCWYWVPGALPMLLAGGVLGCFLPRQQEYQPRRTEVGTAQVRLELAAGVFSQVQLLLLEATAPPIDEEALVLRAVDKACGSCPCRKTCRDRQLAAALSPQLLHRPLLDSSDLHISCRKEGRLLQEFHRAQEQLRAIRAAREEQKEYRLALLQQYQFLSEYLQDLSDELGKRVKSTKPRYKPLITLCANRLEADNGDRCQSFSGTLCRHYVLLCDGMGTGMGAIDEGRSAVSLLKKLLSAGFPAEYALRSLNSLCALRGAAGAVTVDLAELHLDTGKALLYKWGAAPSYVLSEAGTEKIGTAGPPPGLSVSEHRENVERLSLRRGETLVLCSDGVGGEDALRHLQWEQDTAAEELAAGILEAGGANAGDDATVAVVRLTALP